MCLRYRNIIAQKEQVYVYEIEWVPITNRWYQLKIYIHNKHIWVYMRIKIDTNWKSSMIPIDITIKVWYNSYHNEEYELVKMKNFVN